MDNGLVLCNEVKYGTSDFAVLILIIVDNGLVQIYSRSKHRSYESLNPCCSGQWSSTHFYRLLIKIYIVLILVVVDNGLVHKMATRQEGGNGS